MGQTTLVDTLGRRNRQHADKACVKCGAIFRPRRAEAAYCSAPCARSKNGGWNRKSECWWTNTRGYVEGRVRLPDGTQRRVKRHRYVMEMALGRTLLPNEDVHHIDGDKQNNALDNLELLSHSEHTLKTNERRPYKKGYKLDLTAEERGRRADRMRLRHQAALAKAHPLQGKE